MTTLESENEAKPTETSLNKKSKVPHPKPYVTGNIWAPICLRKLRCCASCMEHSGCAKALGKFNIGGEKGRRPLMSIALISSCLTLILAILSCLGFENRPDLVTSFAWSRGTINVKSIDRSRIIDMNIHFNIGLGGIIANTSNVPKWLMEAKEKKLKQLNKVQAFDSKPCKEGFLSETTNSTFCADCKEASASMLVPAIFAVITCLPSIQTDIQRMFPRYDLNCQKFMAVFVAGMFGTISTLVTLYGYSSGCWRNFPGKGEHEIKQEGSLSGPIRVTFDGEWYGGPGLALMIAATLFKIVNLACHLMVPTPNFCRSHDGENPYVKIVYRKESKENSKDMNAEKISLQEDIIGEKEVKNINEEKVNLNEGSCEACNKSQEKLEYHLEKIEIILSNS